MEEFSLDNVLSFAVLDTSLLFREMLLSDNSDLLWASILAFLDQAGVDPEECHRIYNLVLEQIKKEKERR